MWYTCVIGHNFTLSWDGFFNFANSLSTKVSSNYWFQSALWAPWTLVVCAWNTYKSTEFRGTLMYWTFDLLNGGKRFNRYIVLSCSHFLSYILQAFGTRIVSGDTFAAGCAVQRMCWVLESKHVLNISSWFKEDISVGHHMWYKAYCRTLFCTKTWFVTNLWSPSYFSRMSSWLKDSAGCWRDFSRLYIS